MLSNAPCVPLCSTTEIGSCRLGPGRSVSQTRNINMAGKLRSVLDPSIFDLSLLSPDSSHYSSGEGRVVCRTRIAVPLSFSSLPSSCAGAVRVPVSVCQNRPANRSAPIVYLRQPQRAGNTRIHCRWRFRFHARPRLRLEGGPDGGLAAPA